MSNEAEASGRFLTPGEVCRCRIQPVVRNEGANDETMPGGENDFSFLRFGFADYPSVTSRLVERCLRSAPVDVNQQRLVLEICRLGIVTGNYLFGVHGPIVVAARPTNDICKPGVCVDKGGFNLEGRFVIHSMTVDDVCHLKSGKAYLPEPFYLIAKFVAFQVLLVADMRKYAIALALPDIECLRVPWVNESVDIGQGLFILLPGR